MLLHLPINICRHSHFSICKPTDLSFGQKHLEPYEGTAKVNINYNSALFNTHTNPCTSEVICYSSRLI